MSESYQVFRVLLLATSIIMCLLAFGVVGAALFRFKKTTSGVLLAIGFGGYALIMAINLIAARSLALGMSDTTFMVFRLTFEVLEILLTLVAAAGITLIPKSLMAMRTSK